MRRPARGFTGVEILVTVAIVGAVLTLVPQLNPIAMLQRAGGGGSVSAANQKASWTDQSEKTKPVFYSVPPTATQPGMVAVATETEKTYHTGAEEKPQVLTFGQRVAKFFAGLSTWGVVLVGGGFAILFFIFGITPGMVWRHAKIRAEEVAAAEKADKERYKKALKQTVEGIRNIKDQAVYDVATDSLKAAQDKDVKQIIDVVKSELH